jgi:thiol-disulfide isomerase/thioredoxin
MNKKRLLFGGLLILALVVVGCSPAANGDAEAIAPEVMEPTEAITETPPAESEVDPDQETAESEELVLEYLDDFVFEDAQGNEIRMSDYAGKMVVLDYWATSCGYCIKEMPDLARIDAEYEDVVIISVSIGDSARSLQKYIDDQADKGIVYEHDLVLDVNNSAWVFNVTGTPTKVYVGPNREFIGAVPGAAEYEDNVATIERVFEILDEIEVELY